MGERQAVKLSLPAKAESLAEIRTSVCGLARALGADPDVVADIRLALNEACTNVVLHAYDEEAGAIEVEARPEGTKLVVLVSDSGHGIADRLQRKSPGLGLGFPLIRTVSDVFQIRGERGTQVEMGFYLNRSQLEEQWRT